MVFVTDGEQRARDPDQIPDEPPETDRRHSARTPGPTSPAGSPAGRRPHLPPGLGTADLPTVRAARVAYRAALIGPAAVAMACCAIGANVARSAASLVSMATANRRRCPSTITSAIYSRTTIGVAMP